MCRLRGDGIGDRNRIRNGIRIRNRVRIRIWNRESIRPLTLIPILILLASLTFPRDASAQRAQVIRAFADLCTALDGTFGDEGGEVASRLANLSEAVSNWDRSIRETEQNVRTRLEGASPDAEAGAHETLGSLYLERGRFADAVKEFETASALAPRLLSARLSRAVASRRSLQSISSKRRVGWVV